MSDPLIKIKVGIIGGSFFDQSIIDNVKEKEVVTVFGDPSDKLLEGEISGVPVVVLSRHGRGHNIMPSNVNYRANIWALKMEGCTHILVTSAVGSLREHIKPGHLLIPHDYIDRTCKRALTFYDGQEGHPKKVIHMPSRPAYSEPLRELVIKTLEDMKLADLLHRQGVGVCIEGPRFATKAESEMHRMFGGDFCTMTTVPEVQLAKEAGILYASIAIITDYDSWNETAVNVEEVKAAFSKQKPIVVKAVIECVRRIGETNWDKAILEAKEVVSSAAMS